MMAVYSSARYFPADCECFGSDSAGHLQCLMKFTVPEVVSLLHVIAGIGILAGKYNTKSCVNLLLSSFAGSQRTELYLWLFGRTVGFW